MGKLHARYPMTAQQGRTARLFALCAAALMQASKWEISGISDKQASQGIMVAFADWYELQPKGSYEEARIREAAERFALLVPRFVRLGSGTLFYPHDWAGYVQDNGEGDIYDVLPAVFLAHFCDGDRQRIPEACKVLGEQMGWLLRPNGSKFGDKKRWQHRRRVKEELISVYRFRGAQPPGENTEENDGV